MDLGSCLEKRDNSDIFSKSSFLFLYLRHNFPRNSQVSLQLGFIIPVTAQGHPSPADPFLSFLFSLWPLSQRSCKSHSRFQTPPPPVPSLCCHGDGDITGTWGRCGIPGGDLCNADPVWFSILVRSRGNIPLWMENIPAEFPAVASTHRNILQEATWGVSEMIIP